MGSIFQVMSHLSKRPDQVKGRAAFGNYLATSMGFGVKVSVAWVNDIAEKKWKQEKFNDVECR